MRYIILLLITFPFYSTAQQAVDIEQAMQIAVTYTSDTEATFTWRAKENTTSYVLSYREKGESFFSPVGEPLSPDDTTFTLSDLNPEFQLGEFKIQQVGGRAATGYITTGLEYRQPTTQRGLLIVVEQELAPLIADQLQAYINVLEDELWTARTITVGSAETVTVAKEAIQAEYDMGDIQSVLLVGHVPVPYSGNNAIDGHTSGNNHRGAWAADCYYGDLDGNWTDTSVNNEEATRDDNKNIPGDGKFDQNFIPSDMELAVGRIDFSDLPAFADDEATLTNKYLAKNIAYRTGQYEGTRRGLVDNNFGLGEGFGQGAIKSFSSFFPVDSIDYGVYRDLNDKDYLWSYGAGGGSYRSASGIINTNQLATDSIRSIFTTIFGSYFGDWDNTDNLLRASLASGTTLINAWSGRPVWHFHDMAMGATVGDVLVNVQDDNGNYYSQFGKRLTHIALMGDPTLQMYYSAPVADVTSSLTDETLSISWAESEGADGYDVYIVGADGLPFRINEELLTEPTINIDCPSEGTNRYVVRPMTLEESPSGSYYSAGAGASVETEVILPQLEAIFEFGQVLPDEVSFFNNSTGASTYFWTFGDGTFSEEENPAHTYTQSGTYDVTLVASSNCKQDTFTITLSIIISSTDDTDQQYTIQPNPTSDFITLTGNIVGEYTLVNLLGAIVQSGQIQTTTHRLYLEDLPAGIYFLQIANGRLEKVVKR